MKKKIFTLVIGLVIISATLKVNKINVFAITQDEMVANTRAACEEYGIDYDDLSTTGNFLDSEKVKEIEEIINSKSNASQNSQPVKNISPSTFTVDECENTDGWAIKKCNIRKGASTEYEVVGSLQKDDKVIITGVASTGWYRIKTDTLDEVYVSNTLITKENPNVITEEPTTTEEETTVEPTTEETTTVEEETSIEEITTVEEITTIEEQTTTEEETTIEEIPINYTNWYVIGGVALVVIVITVIAITRRKHK